MKKTKSILIFTTGIILSTFFYSGCLNEKAIPDYQQFPDDVGKIVFTKCATTGCHNDISKGAAGGLSMESHADIQIQYYVLQQKCSYLFLQYRLASSNQLRKQYSHHY